MTDDDKSYELWGMNYRGFNLDHDANLPMHKVLKRIARWLKDNDKEGYVESITTNSHPDNENRLLTTVIWSDTTI